jgi:hypothetical protein
MIQRPVKSTGAVYIKGVNYLAASRQHLLEGSVGRSDGSGAAGSERFKESGIQFDSEERIAAGCSSMAACFSLALPYIPSILRDFFDQ